jgi:hypothetical protein
MGYAIELINLDEVFQTSTQQPVVVNDFNISSQEDREMLSKLIYTHYEGDSLHIVPTCECGELRGEFNRGIRCHKCNSIVMAVTERPLESVLWISSPKGVGPFINPILWIQLSSALTYNGINLLEYLTNPTMALTGNLHKTVRKLQSLNIERGINYFHEHFDRIIEMLYAENIFKPQKKHDIMRLLRRYRHAVFTRHLPMPSKLGFITEKTAVNSYADNTMLLAIDALRTISSTVNAPTPFSLKVMQARAMQANAMLAEYHESFMKKSMGTKEGWWRSHVFGSRLHFTYRAVISSLSDKHDYDEIHLPWSVAVMVLKVHLTAKLFWLGYTPNEANQFLHEHMQKYHPLLAQLFQELIDESPYGGIPSMFSRNPTLQRGSMQLFRITKIKSDPRVNSVDISVLCLKAPNADFDGDALNGILVLDHRMYEALSRLQPHLGLLDTRKPRTLSKNGIIPAPVITTMSAWVHEGEDD